MSHHITQILTGYEGFSIKTQSLPVRILITSCGFLIHFINKNQLKTCFDHNFSRSSPIRPSFCTLPELILLSTKQTLNPRKNALSWKQNYRAEPSPRALENSNSLSKTKKGESLHIFQILFRPSKRPQRKKQKMHRVLLFKLLRMVLWWGS